jgi:RecA/RadA recombinase
VAKRRYDPDRDRVRMPIELINIANNGGYSFESIVEAWGRSLGGKSTVGYQGAEYFLEDYAGQARVLILNAENAVNHNRLKMVFHIDTRGDPRVVVRPAFTIEQANDTLLRQAQECREQNLFLYGIWDSITASSFKRAYEAIQKSLDADEGKEKTEKEEKLGDRGATEPLAKAQVMRWCLNNVLHAMYGRPFFLFLINQATTKVNQFQASVSSAGGFALQHNANERIRIEKFKTIGGDSPNAIYKTGTMSHVTVEKSRNIPYFQDVPIIIDDTAGGRIVPENELPLVAVRFGVLSTARESPGWYSVTDAAPAALRKKWSLRDVMASPDMLAYLRRAITAELRVKFKLVDYSYALLGGGGAVDRETGEVSEIDTGEQLYAGNGGAAGGKPKAKKAKPKPKFRMGATT